MNNNNEQHDEIIYVARNPITNKLEQVYTVDEVIGTHIIKMYWAADRYVTIPENDDDES